jgi:hypothetical protein
MQFFLGGQERNDDLSGRHRWYRMAEVISHTQALACAGIKAKTMVCYDAVTNFQVHNDVETHLIRSLFRDIQSA